MKAVILAAGVGKRLSGKFQALPKCLIPLGGKPLLFRMLSALQAAGVRDCVIVVGYEREKIESFVSQCGPLAEGVRFCYNPDFTRGSIRSLWEARGEFDDDLLIMDADVLFSDQLLSRLIGSSHANAVLIDPRAESGGEEMMLMVRKGRVLRIGRQVEESYDLLGEGVGFFKLSLRDAPLLKEILEEMMAQGQDDQEYESAIDYFLKRCEVGYELVGDLPWTEIDFPQDVEKAEQEVLPLL